ncbi:putative DEAD/DEAH box helicase [Geopyxis carbonaria]|nr:putative DEAD/DEAH box helicase [Geopyxis carbonaria]
MPPRKRKLSSKDEPMPRAPRRRKLPWDTSNEPNDTSSHPFLTPVKKPRAPKKPSKSAKPAIKQEEQPDAPPPAPSTIPWPAHFTALAKVHSALNLVYTFLSSRKTVATTFATLRTAVEGHIRRPLTVADVAQIRALLPRSVHFEYVDEEALAVYVAGSATIKARDEAFDIAHKQKEVQEERGREVLLFEFVDGSVKDSVLRGVQTATARVGDGYRAARREEAKTPAAGTKAMTALVAKRNEKFKAAVDAFLAECAARGEDAVEAITQCALPALSDAPVPAAANDVPAEIPSERKPIPEILTELKQSDLWSDQIVPGGHRVFPPQPAAYGELTFALSQALVNALYTAFSVTQFYTHQAAALNALHAGAHVIVSTATASGKSLIYQLPVLHALEAAPQTRALFVFPTKALAQDQRRSFGAVLACMRDSLGPVAVETFDGDTPPADRRRIRDDAAVVLTNPDTLHAAILPHNAAWQDFLRNLRYVVVDELHAYAGVFGAHVAFVLRRLRRVCAALGNTGVQFVSCSATIANPGAHMAAVFGLARDTVAVIDADGSPAGEKSFVLWNTPLDALDIRGDAVAEAARLFVALVLRGVRTIAFCRVRTACETLLRAAQDELRRRGRAPVAERVMSYRGGYAAQDRRRIEAELFSGALVGVVATSALELGVDIGALDAVVIVNFPHSLAALRQQSGRAGRRNRDSLTVLVGGAGGGRRDQHYMQHPDEVFEAPTPPLSLDLASPLVRAPQLQCAAFDAPLHPEHDAAYFSASPTSSDPLPTAALVAGLDGFYHPARSYLPYPPAVVSIRASAGDDDDEKAIALIDVTNARNVVLEELDPERALFSLFEGAIYLHMGRTYLVRDVNPEKGFARVEAVKVAWTTRARTSTAVEPLEVELTRGLGGVADPGGVADGGAVVEVGTDGSAPAEGTAGKAFFGPVSITHTLTGYTKLNAQRRVIESVDVAAPAQVRVARGVWIPVPAAALTLLQSRRMRVADAVAVAAEAVLGGGGEWGVKTEGGSGGAEGRKIRRLAEMKDAAGGKGRQGRKGGTGTRLVFYDPRGGEGNARRVFDHLPAMLADAVGRVEGEGKGKGKEREKGETEEEVVARAGAAVVLRCVLGWRVDVEALPMGGVEGWTEEEEEGERDGEMLAVGEGVVKLEQMEVREGVMYDPHSVR